MINKCITPDNLYSNLKYIMKHYITKVTKNSNVGIEYQ
jgi:hypothetical protein